MSCAEYSSGDLARATGQTVRAIRFYEEQGLLRPASLSEGGHRRYTADDLDKLHLIADLRELGLSLCEVRAMLELGCACASELELSSRLAEVLAVHLEHTERRIERLHRMKREFSEVLAVVRARLGLASGDVHSCACAASDALGDSRISRVVSRAFLAAGARSAAGEGNEPERPPALER